MFEPSLLLAGCTGGRESSCDSRRSYLVRILHTYRRPQSRCLMRQLPTFYSVFYIDTIR